MKELLLLGVVAFLVATGGGTWFAAFLAPPRPPRLVAVESGPPAKALVKAAVKTAIARKPAGAMAATVGASGKPAPTSDTGANQPAPAVAPDASAQSPAPALAGIPASDPKAAKAVGKILVAMKPAQAAKILEKLTDDDIEAIIRQLNAKQVAPLLVALPGERAVAMSRRLLGVDLKREGKS